MASALLAEVVGNTDMPAIAISIDRYLLRKMSTRSFIPT